MSPRPFRFGVMGRTTMTTRRAWIEMARRAEAAGFTALTVVDHFFTSGGIWSALVSAYDAAPSLRVGTLVLNNALWQPAVVAREAITADVLTDGAFELGIGAGWDPLDYAASGIERRPPRVRIEALEEAIEIIRQAFSGDPPRFQGTYYSADSQDPWPRPRQPHVPLLVGGGGRRILELAARHADIVSINRDLQRGRADAWSADAAYRGPHRDAISRRVSWVREAAGHRFDMIELHALVLKVVVTPHRRAVAANLAHPLGVTPEHLLASPQYLIGTVDELAADLVERRRRWGISYWTIKSADLDAFAPILARSVDM